MSTLIVGLVIFLGTHSVRIVADDWRSAQVARMGLLPWKGLYALVSLVGFVLICWGVVQTRAEPVFLWMPPRWTHHLTALLMLPAFVLIVAAYVPGNRIKATIGHPMLAGTKLWALAHLIANGRLADVVLFGAFLVWAVLAFRSCRRRDKAAGVTYPVAKVHRDIIVIVVSLALWIAFATFLHLALIGVKPFA